MGSGDNPLVSRQSSKDKCHASNRRLDVNYCIPSVAGFLVASFKISVFQCTFKRTSNMAAVFAHTVLSK